MARVLIVDDSNVIRGILKNELENLGHAVVAEAAGGREAVRLFATASPDLVLMDVALEDIDGLEAIRRIRAVSKTARIIIVSALARENVAAAADGLGVDGYLGKPFTPEDLRGALAACHV
jgi:two-component system chemotaxis response regulator CheY